MELAKANTEKITESFRGVFKNLIALHANAATAMVKTGCLITKPIPNSSPDKKYLGRDGSSSNKNNIPPMKKGTVNISVFVLKPVYAGDELVRPRKAIVKMPAKKLDVIL